MQMRRTLWLPAMLALTSFTAFGCGAGHKVAGAGLSSAELRGASALAAGGPAASGAVYTMTNATAGNAVLAFPRSADGALGAPASYATGGAGTGAGLGNQGGLALGTGNRWLFVVNAGSNDVSVFRVGPSGLTLTDREPSGGTLPISVTADHDVVYVLNAGGAGNIQGFHVSPAGALTAIAGSNRPLSSASAGPAQIGFTPDGDALIVTEKATNTLSLYRVGADGAASGPETHASSGATPFGFGFDQTRTLVVSEAFGGAPGASAVSSYRVAGGDVSLVSGSVHTGQTAACWIAVTANGRYAFTTNAGSANIAGYAVGAGGVLTKLDGVTATGAGPSEMALTNGSRFLYALAGRANEIDAFAVAADGSLARVAVAGVPGGVNGVVAR